MTFDLCQICAVPIARELKGIGLLSGPIVRTAVEIKAKGVS